MPIEIDSTSTVAPAPNVPIVATLLYVDRLTIDEHERPASDADVMLKPPTLDLVATPYAVDADGNRTYAAVAEAIKSGNAYALAAVVPEVGQAMGAIFAAVAAVRRRIIANRDALVEANAAVGAAQAVVAEAQAAIDAATAARDAAFVAWNAIDDQTSQAWRDGQAASFAGRDAYEAALATLANKQSAAAAAQARVTIATAAVADPANPPLTEATT